ncbi:unnamed protein product [Rhodiola kirilowii]
MVEDIAVEVGKGGSGFLAHTSFEELCGVCLYTNFEALTQEKHLSLVYFFFIVTMGLFGVFDGHGGSRASEYLKEHLFDNLTKHPKFMLNTKLALSQTFSQTDSGFLDAERDTFRDDGSTASTAILLGNHLYVANVGDSRTVMSKSGKAIALSEDHKPNRRDERKRIEKAGGVVMWAGTWRVGGVLAMSRAFGNRLLKQFVLAEPDIQDLEISKDMELLVLASDGLWDVVPNEDAISIALSEDEPEAAAKKLTDVAFARGSCDNITCLVVRFHHEKLNPSGCQATSSTQLTVSNTTSNEKSDSNYAASDEASTCSQVTFPEQSGPLYITGAELPGTAQSTKPNSPVLSTSPHTIRPHNENSLHKKNPK